MVVSGLVIVTVVPAEKLDYAARRHVRNVMDLYMIIQTMKLLSAMMILTKTLMIDTLQILLL